jgi:xanthine/CO dehydrogenase XdhC/CoxF family maturation factor
VDAEGRVLAGAVSGGCLEGDVAAHAAGVCASGIPKLLTYDLGDDLQEIWGFGAMCDGIAHLFIEPLGQGAWLERAREMRAKRESGALVTRVEETSRGGTHHLDDLPPDECVALSGIVRAAAETGFPVFRAAERVGRDADSAADDAAGAHHAQSACFVEPLVPPIALVLIGAGRGADAFAQIGHTLGWHVTLIDHRPFVLYGVSVPDSVTRVVGRASDGIRSVPRDARTAVALLTHQFAIDREWLAQLLPSPVAYIGVLGSRQRATRLVDALREDGVEVTPRMHRRLHAPIGLDLGGESPESIALAAVAEIEAVMHARPGGSLRARQTPIHTRTPTPHVVSDADDASCDAE